MVFVPSFCLKDSPYMLLMTACLFGGDYITLSGTPHPFCIQLKNNSFNTRYIKLYTFLTYRV